MAQFQKKGLVFEASRSVEDGVVETSHGPRRVSVGEWILKTGDSTWVLPDFIFRSLYDPVDDEARTMMKGP